MENLPILLISEYYTVQQVSQELLKNLWLVKYVNSSCYKQGFSAGSWIDYKKWTLGLVSYNMIRPAFTNSLFPVTRPHTNLPPSIDNYYCNLDLEIQIILQLKIKIL